MTDPNTTIDPADETADVTEDTAPEATNAGEAVEDRQSKTSDAAESVAFSFTFDDAEEPGLDEDIEENVELALEAADADEVTQADASDAETDVAVPKDASADATAANARRVNATIALASDALASQDATPKPKSAATANTKLGAQLGDRVLLKAYPAFSLNHVTTTNRKTGRHVLDDVSMEFHVGNLYAIRVLADEDDAEQRVTLMQTLGGYRLSASGNVMVRSSNVAELEIGELRGHRLGIVPQRYAVRGDMDAESNVLYAMNASGRTYLKPKPIYARDMLHTVGFPSATSGVKTAAMTPLERRRVALARAISCEAETLILDEPVKGLDEADAEELLALLARLAHARDPKRAVIIVTASDRVASVADKVYRLDD